MCGKPIADGWNVALKPAYEPIILARKPLSGTVAATVLAHGTGALNIDASRIGLNGEVISRDFDKQKDGNYSAGGNYAIHGKAQTAEEAAKVNTPRSGVWTNTLGRWPPNVLLDPDAAAALDAQSGRRGGNSGGRFARSGDGWGTGNHEPSGYRDTGGASRFFPVLPIDDPDTLRYLYQPKASRSERNRGLPEGVVCSHPTVKPLALMRWLLTLVTPPGGTVLDPFAGSGTTGVAAAALGIPCVLIEQEAEYLPIIAGRIDHALDERAGAELPLFAGVAD